MRYDVIVVGARCAGSPTAMLLARAGLRVLLVDKATFPSDTISGHFVKTAGVKALARWGLEDAVVQSGCPPIRSVLVDIGGSATRSELPPELPSMFAPRRLVLDELLVKAAASSGAEVRERFTVTRLLREGERVSGIEGASASGRAIRETARFVVGADGRDSRVARLVGAAMYGTHPTVSFAYYAYWSGVPVNGGELHFRKRRAIGLFPTHEQATLIFTQGPIADAQAFKANLKSSYLASLRSVPEVEDRIDRGSLDSPIFGMISLPNFFRQPFGPGWALVGDSGHHKDPLVARGISDAFRDSEFLADALARSIAGADEHSALAAYQRARDLRSTRVAGLNTQLAKLDAPLPDAAKMLERLGEAEGEADAS